MTATRTARPTVGQIARRIVAAAAIAAVVGGGVLAGAASASTFPPLHVDLIGSGPTSVVVFNAQGSVLFARVANIGTLRSPSTTASITYQPVSRFTTSSGTTYYVNTPGSTPISATGSVNSVAAGSSVGFYASATGVPSGTNRITVCADTSGAVSESSETNNCWSEIKTVQVTYAA